MIIAVWQGRSGNRLCGIKLADIASIESVPGVLDLPGCPYQRFHVVEVFLQRFAAGSGQAVLRSRYTAIETLRTSNVPRFFQFAGVYAQVSVCRLKELFQLIERQVSIDRKSAQNSQSKTLMNNTVNMRGSGFRPQDLVRFGAFVQLPSGRRVS